MVTVGPFPSQLLWNVDIAQPSLLASQHLTNLLRSWLWRTGSKYEFNLARGLLSRLPRILDEVRAPENIKKKEENLFDNNSKCEDCECDSAYVNHHSKGVYDKSSHEEMSEMSCDEFLCSD